MDMNRNFWTFILVCVTYAHCDDKLHTTDALAPSSNCNTDNCLIFFKHLKGRCEPIYGGSCCPIAFNCSQEKQPRDKSYCTSNGKKYEAGEPIDGIPCRLCSCVARAANETSISCNGFDCPRAFPRPGDDCISVSLKDVCCDKRYCGEEKKKLPLNVKCAYGGKVYDYGRTFYPERCTSCVCNEHWDSDITNNQTCETIQCNFDIDIRRFEAGCEPVYIEGQCCPYFICPDEVNNITAPTKPGKCFQSVDQGEGDEEVFSFYFNPKKNLCDVFTYKGNGGNDNRFKTHDECMKECGDGYDTCDLKPETGNCYAHFTKIFYNKESKRCEPFLYGGCGGNANNFNNVEECETHCKNTKDHPKCVFDGMEFEKGQHLVFNPVYPKPCVEVKCVAPPHLTFTHRSCPDPPTDRNCQAKYSADKCCPEYVCEPERRCILKRYHEFRFALGCEAKYSGQDVDKNCPLSFSCPEDTRLSEQHCYVKGNLYKIGEEITNGTDPCQRCFCSSQASSTAPVVDCKRMECHPGPLITKQGETCYNSYQKVSACCPLAKCVSSDELRTCQIDNRIYYDGQKIYPALRPCIVCHCNKNWTGVDGPTCEKIECDYEMQRDRLMQHCIPIYVSNFCCPIDWVCPGTNKLPQKADESKYCYFNRTQYNVGYYLNYPEQPNCVKCECIAPSKFSCIQETCVPPPKPKHGYRCIPKYKEGDCCPSYDCIPIPSPCDDVRCNSTDRCVRVVENCKDPPCQDRTKCVPQDHVPCDDLSCDDKEICVSHKFPCETKDNCPYRAVCLPSNPCENSDIKCESGKVCKNLIPQCRLSPCPKAAICVSDDPCDDSKCPFQNHVCIAYTPACSEQPCHKESFCASPDCPQVACAPDSIFRRYGSGKGNCPWCEEKET